MKNVSNWRGLGWIVVELSENWNVKGIPISLRKLKNYTSYEETYLYIDGLLSWIVYLAFEKGIVEFII